MTILEFIFSTLALIVGGIVILGIVVCIYDYRRLENENEILKNELEKLRSLKIKKQYKGVKNVK